VAEGRLKVKDFTLIVPCQVHFATCRSFPSSVYFSSQNCAEMYRLRFLNLKIRERGTVLNVVFLAMPLSKGCIPTAYARCFQATACWKAVTHLKGFHNQQIKCGVLTISLFLKCHSLLHLLDVLMGEFGLRLLFMLTLVNLFTA